MKILRSLLAACLCLFSVTTLAAPKADLWPRWRLSDHMNSEKIDHSAWEAFLGKYVKASPDGVNRVAYGAVSDADKHALDQYLDAMQAVHISGHSSAEQRAYWINLYNAATLKVVLDHYPVKSILEINISPGWFAKGPWGRQLLMVEDEPITLDDIEHRILRPVWKDPRTHYSVNCASYGCPNLQPHAFTPANMDAMLDAAARAYVNHPRGARVENGQLIVSSIYTWFKEDFGGDDAGVIAHLRKYAEPKLAAQLVGITRISDDRYDWSLNEAR